MEIAETAWHQALCILPPEDWRSDANGDSFKSAERTAGAITAIYVRINNRHFTFNDEATTPHTDCLRRVATSRAWREGQESPAR